MTFTTASTLSTAPLRVLAEFVFRRKISTMDFADYAGVGRRLD